MNYLERKNEQWKRTVEELIEEKREYDVFIFTEDEDNYVDDGVVVPDDDNVDNCYYDLVTVVFEDEGGYERAITIPFPLADRELLADLFNEANMIVFKDRECYRLNDSGWLYEYNEEE